MEILQLSSMAKVFPNKIYGSQLSSAQAARGQCFYYQLAFKGNGKIRFEIESELKEYITLHSVGCVPMDMPAYEGCTDNDYLTFEKGPCPDPLFPLEDNTLEIGQEYKAIWVDINVPEGIAHGTYAVKFIIYCECGEKYESVLMLDVQRSALPPQEHIVTQWFHTDCIADVHNVPVFSEEHWLLIENYLRLAAESGINMILTPVLTPPLDTEVGGERTTVQLVKIQENNGEYTFDFSKLHRFIDVCLKCGIKYFEINHMFTQWGAKSTPKVVKETPNGEERIFGWETSATSDEYKNFLGQLIPAVIRVFDEKGIDRSRIYFHVSDEPNHECMEEYKSAHDILDSLIDGCNQMDAITHFEYYERGIIKTPVVATNKVEPFMEANVKNLWCYYCCAQNDIMANRFMAMPSYRNRIIGVQMYRCSIVGFLQWGYNFYNLQFSKGKINPYEVTDAGGAFPSGDAFSVYPYKNTAIPSLRIKVFKNALEDIRLLKLLEAKIGKTAVDELIDRVAGMKVTFKSYPRSEEFFTKLYEEIFKILEQ